MRWKRSDTFAAVVTSHVNNMTPPTTNHASINNVVIKFSPHGLKNDTHHCFKCVHGGASTNLDLPFENPATRQRTDIVDNVKDTILQQNSQWHHCSTCSWHGWFLSCCICVLGLQVALVVPWQLSLLFWQQQTVCMCNESCCMKQPFCSWLVHCHPWFHFRSNTAFFSPWLGWNLWPHSCVPAENGRSLAEIWSTARTCCLINTFCFSTLCLHCRLTLLMRLLQLLLLLSLMLFLLLPLLHQLFSLLLTAQHFHLLMIFHLLMRIQCLPSLFNKHDHQRFNAICGSASDPSVFFDDTVLSCTWCCWCCSHGICSCHHFSQSNSSKWWEMHAENN